MKFTGHERDLASGVGTGDDLDYMHARHYSPVTGQFLAIDVAAGSSEQPQSWNRYLYGYGNPMKYVDPDGKDGITFSDYAGATYSALAKTTDQIAFALVSPYFHFRAGVMNDDPVELAKAGGLIAFDALGGLALKEGAYALRLGWTSRGNLLAHFRIHGAEFGFKMAESYAVAARKLVQSAGQEGVEAIVTANGEKMVYNAATKEFAMVNKEGKIVTYYKASLKYWQRKVKSAASSTSAAPPSSGAAQ